MSWTQYITTTNTLTTYPVTTTITYDQWNDNTTYKWQQPNSYQWPAVASEEKKDHHMEKCHLCEAELTEISVDEWRENVAKKNKDPEWEWRKKTHKKFACGTVKRDGDLADGEKRVVLGEDCIEVG